MKRPWLAPLIPIYAAGAALRARRYESNKASNRRLKWPVISIGNLSTGGAGKTPLTIALAGLLSARGIHVDVLSRGYGRKSKQPLLVNPEGGAQEFGDEPLLIARAACVPVYVASQRFNAGLLAETESNKGKPQPRVHLLDDGFQHRQLHRDIDILLVNHEDLHDTLLPAGNLREPLRALQRASVLAIPADEPETESHLREILLIDRNSESSRWLGPIWRMRRTMEIPKTDGPIFAFCGIARPHQFFAGLEEAGLHIAGRHAFADHHHFTEHGIEGLIASARKANATALLTTEKDAVRLGPLASSFPSDLPLKTVPLRVEIQDEPAAIEWILSRLSFPS